MTESMSSPVPTEEVVRLLKVGMQRCLLSNSNISPDYDNARAMLRALDSFGDLSSVVGAIWDGQPSVMIEEGLRLLLKRQEKGELTEALRESGFLALDVEVLNERITDPGRNAWNRNVKRLAQELTVVSML